MRERRQRHHRKLGESYASSCVGNHLDFQSTFFLKNEYFYEQAQETKMFLLFALVTVAFCDTVHVTLRQQNLPQFYQRVVQTNVPDSEYFLKFMSHDDITAMIAPPRTVRLQVIEWLNKIGIDNSTIIDGGDVISFPYRTGIHKYLIVPNYLTNIVDIIIGAKPTQRFTQKRGHSSQPESGYVGREVIQRLYNVSDLRGSVDIGVVQYDPGEGYSVDDLHSYQEINGLPRRNVSHHVGYGTGYAGGEGSLDIQMISNLADANMWFIYVHGWIYDFARDFFHRTDYPTVISHSYGWSERDQCAIVHCFGFTAADYVRRTNVELAKVALKGVTLLASSGDAGSPGRTDEGCGNSTTEPIYPSSSPWVVSVGASYVVKSDNTQSQTNTPLCRKHHCVTGTIEAETSFNETEWTYGSGFGIYSEPQNVWQRAAVEKYLNTAPFLPPKTAFNRAGRGYPDVSAVGHLCAIYRSGSLITEDGTSCSSPVTAALVGHISAVVGSRLGLLTPMLYDAWYADPSTFNDITVGNSQCIEMQCCKRSFGFQASNGWDAASGLGTPNVGKIIERLQLLTS